MARAVGRSARDLDATHRRDGIGLLLFTLTIVVAAVTWFSVDGWLTGIVTAIVTGAVGALDVVVPLFLLWATLRVLRHPDQGSTTGRLAIGTGDPAGLGVRDLVAGQGRARVPSDGAEAMRAAGGWVGWLVTAPIVSAVGIWLAYLWLVALMGFGLLVVTATPIHAVPERLGALRDARAAAPQPRGHVRGGEPPAGDMAVDGRAKHAALAQDPEADASAHASTSVGWATPRRPDPRRAAAGPQRLRAQGPGAGTGARHAPTEKDVEVPVYDGPLAGDEAFVSAVATAPGVTRRGGPHPHRRPLRRRCSPRRWVRTARPDRPGAGHLCGRGGRRRRAARPTRTWPRSWPQWIRRQPPSLRKHNTVAIARPEQLRLPGGTGLPAAHPHDAQGRHGARRRAACPTTGSWPR